MFGLFFFLLLLSLSFPLCLSGAVSLGRTDGRPRGRRHSDDRRNLPTGKQMPARAVLQLMAPWFHPFDISRVAIGIEDEENKKLMDIAMGRWRRWASARAWQRRF